MTDAVAAALAPYLPRIAIEWADSDPLTSFREVDGSLLFADISGFTALSEKLARKGRIGAEELTGTLNECFAALLGVAYEAGGSLLKFGGDALLLYFEGDAHPERACSSALRMRAVMHDAGSVSTSVGRVRLRMSVGVHSGRLHLFRVGQSHRELIVTGPGATATVAMESTASANEIVVSPATASHLDPAVVGAPKGAGLLLRNRGLSAPVDLATTPVYAGPAARVAVPVALREHLLAGDVEPEHRHASVAFVHFEGVDDLIADAGAAAVADALDELVVDVQDAASEHGVTFLASDVDADGGKLILAAGAPRSLGDDGGRMLRCLRTIADRRRALPVRIGVNHGHVFAGEVGPPYRRTYTVMGDAVNLAARLMAKAGPGEILATSAVLDHSSSEFACTAIPPFTVKGKTAPVAAFAVGAVGARRHSRHDDSLPFTGRESEAAELADALNQARAGRGSVIEVTGEPAIGKSRLVDEVLASAHDVTVLRAFCEPHETTTPYFALRFLVRSLVGDDLAGFVAEHAPDLRPWLPLLATVAGFDVPDTPETSALEPQFRRERTSRSVIELLHAAVSEPTVFVIEDAQWLDALSAEVVAAMAPTAERPWLVCVVRRDGEESPLGDATVRTLRLGPLSDDAVRALLSTETRLLPHERDAFVARAGGNPMFVAELLRARTESNPDDPLPESLEAVVAAQIDRLPPTDRRLLRYASVLGTTFDVALLAAVTDDGITTAAQAGRRFGAFLEAAGDGLLRFRNDCYRQVAYDALPFARRRDLHGRAGIALERSTVGRELDRAAALSFHFLHAQRYEQCWQYSLLAAEQARASYANAEAAALYERALAVRRHVPASDGHDLAATFEALGDVCLFAGEFSRAQAAFSRARAERAADPIALAKLCTKQYTVAMHQGRNTAAVRWLRKGLRLLDGHDDRDGIRQRAQLRFTYAHNRLQAGRPRDALRWAELAVEDARRSENHDALASAFLLHDWALLSLGQLTEPAGAREALAIRETLGDPSKAAEVLLYLGNFAYMQGKWSEALELWTRASDAYLRAGNVVDAAFGAGNSAEVLVHQGRYDEAEPRLRQALEVWESMGYSGGVADVLGNLGRLALNRGDVGEASRLFGEVRRLFAAADDAREIGACGALAECLLRQGSVEQALALIEGTLRRARMSGDTQFTSMLHRLRGYASAALGRIADAWADFDESLAIARARSAAYDVALTLEAIAVVAELGGLATDPSADGERAVLLEQLGVIVTPPPPLQLAA